MLVKQMMWNEEEKWQDLDSTQVDNPQLVLFFASPKLMESSDQYDLIREKFPKADIIGCSSAGEIVMDEVWDESVVVSAVQFDNTPIRVASVLIHEVDGSLQAGEQLGADLLTDDLKGILVVSEGLKVNGSELVKGILSIVGEDVPVTGGLAGDGPSFGVTRVSCNGAPEEGRIAAIGFYGQSIHIGHGSVGGWDTFGPERVVTRSQGNVLYELDGKPALELYKKYLGEEASNLPGSGLLYPLMVRKPEDPESGVVRTLLAVNEEEQSMTFAGDIPQGEIAQLMRANFERLIDGAGTAAKIADDNEIEGEKLAVLISCVGRKMILGQRTADEVEAVQELLGDDVAQIGFYSYGEISPHVSTGKCELHNQTMTITIFSEN
ncbi:MAG: FIST N-terminal domain-containing protein [Calditrichota bacterium]